MLNVICAVGNKDIEFYLKNHKQLNVLTVIKKREHILNRIAELNPHTIIISKALQGKTVFEKILLQIRTNYPDIKIVFLYGAEDNESRTFLDFLVRNKIYDFIIGDVDEKTLDDAIFESNSYENVKQYEIPIIADKITTSKIESLEISEKQDAKIPKDIPAEPVYVKQLIGTYKIGITSFFPRSGCTHLTLTLAKWFVNKGIDTGIITTFKVYSAIKNYYKIATDNLSIKGINIYCDKSQIAAAADNEILIYDLGEVDFDFNSNYDRLISINPVGIWEQDNLLDYLAVQSERAKTIDWFIYPVTTEYTQISDLFRGINCKTFAKSYNPEWYITDENDSENFEKMFADIVNLCPSRTRLERKRFFK